MPTAVEIGGLVLGVIGACPAVIEVLQLYKGALKTRSSYHEDQVQALLLDLRVQNALFEGSYRILMGHRDTSALRGPNCDWQSISDSIKSKLENDDHWKTYGELIKSIYDCWKALSSHIVKPPAGRLVFNWIDKTNEMLERIRYAINDPSRCDLLNKLRDSNTALDALVRQQKILPVALSLGCTCTSTHAITVELQSIAVARSLAESSGGYTAAPNSPLEMEMIYKPGINGTIPVPMKLELFFTVGRELYLQHTQQGSLQQTPMHCLAQSMEQTLRNCVVGAKADYPISSQGSLRIDISRKQASTHNSPMSLQSLFGDLSLPCFQNGNFFERDRISMAITLICSVLGLHSTPWLSSAWTSNNIEFLPSSGGITRTSLQRPRITIPLQRDSLMNTGSSAPSFGVRNSSLFALGMILLEILMGTSLASRRTANETEIATAWRLEHVVCSKELPFWRKVVSGCLHCPFSGIDMDLASDPPVLLDCVQTEILQPLLKASRALP
ncbi:uncharacterized protein BDZ99DRAFT_495174 [Mytilinidion resinicola]|uniref:DUF7580 domain-containing protein n=1 Tax=Mytilinidion resinicola TaxID=574789 RepID=A0A6A6Z3M0_9PEZI|nr:uncharacterized protein BDZ99DRAFT_495174 [Mytilinidion resinicola]KAF2815408.1 hypothetical protein BDZ99DRAFT_495174 [Mytilinidion resinicola]